MTRLLPYGWFLESRTRGSRIAGICVVVMTVLVFYQVVMRYVFRCADLLVG